MQIQPMSDYIPREYLQRVSNFNSRYPIMSPVYPHCIHMFPRRIPIFDGYTTIKFALNLYNVTHPNTTSMIAIDMVNYHCYYLYYYQ